MKMFTKRKGFEMNGHLKLFCFLSVFFVGGCVPAFDNNYYLNPSEVKGFVGDSVTISLERRFAFDEVGYVAFSDCPNVTIFPDNNSFLVGQNKVDINITFNSPELLINKNCFVYVRVAGKEIVLPVFINDSISFEGEEKPVIEGEEQGEEEGEVVVEGEGEIGVEGEGEVVVEGEGEIGVEGEGEVVVEGEGEIGVEGEGETPVEGEGEMESEGEITIEGEGEDVVEGEGEIGVEGEGETPVEGEGEFNATVALCEYFPLAVGNRWEGGGLNEALGTFARSLVVANSVYSGPTEVFLFDQDGNSYSSVAPGEMKFAAAYMDGWFCWVSSLSGEGDEMVIGDYFPIFPAAMEPGVPMPHPDSVAGDGAVWFVADTGLLGDFVDNALLEANGLGALKDEEALRASLGADMAAPLYMAVFVKGRGPVLWSFDPFREAAVFSHATVVGGQCENEGSP